MRRMKKILAAAFAVFLAAAPVWGGGGQQSAAPAAAPVSLGALGSLPVVKDKMTYTIAVECYPNWGEPSEGEFWQKWEQETNIHINWVVIRSDSSERYNLMMASGDYPDAFIGGWGGGAENIRKYGVEQKIYIPITKLISEHMTYFQKRAIPVEPDIMKILAATDGEIYSLPFISPDDSYIANAAFINQTWLDKLGLKTPTTTDEFEQVLLAFKTQDPNGNGKADELPLSFKFDDWGAYDHTSYFGAFGYPVNPSDYLIVDKDKVVFNGNQSGYKEAVAWFAKLYKQGLIDKESFTQDQAALVAKQNADPMVIGVFDSWANYSTNHYDDYTVLMPLKGPNGDQNWGKRSNGSVVNPYNFIITNKAKNPEVLIRWADQFYRDFETSFTAAWGVGPDRNKYWYYDANGKMVLNSPVPEKYERGMQQIGFPPIVVETDKFFDVITSAPGVQKDKVDYIRQYTPYIAKYDSGDWENFPPYAAVTNAETEELSTLQTDLLTYTKNQLARWISGDGDVNAEWDAYLKELDVIGLKRYLEIKQTIYNRYKGK